MDGVLYQGGKVIPGAPEVIEWCAQEQIPHLFLTNTTSRPRPALVERLAGFGIPAVADRILTPPLAACRWLTARGSGPVALFVPRATQAEFEKFAVADTRVSAVVVGDLGRGWDFATLNKAFRLLMAEPPPALLALGLTRYWQAEDGLRLDTGPFVRALEYAAGVAAVVLGKPAAPFFETAVDLLGGTAAETVMIGDDIRGDIEGAQRAGLRTVQVRTGKFRPRDLQLGIHPDTVLDSVADLPRWWAETNPPQPIG